MKVPIFVDEKVMQDAAITKEVDIESEIAAAGEGGEGASDRLSAFADFVDSLDLDDLEDSED